jgi:transaldolase
MWAASYFIKSKWFPEESESANGVSFETVERQIKEAVKKLRHKLDSGISFETLSREEQKMLKDAREFLEFIEHRRGKKRSILSKTGRSF